MKRIIDILIKPQEQSLKLQTIRAAFWGFMGKGSAEFLRLISNLILTRLLFPEAFGLMALANSTLMMINLFSDTGVKTAIIQNPKGDNTSFLNTAWIVSICRGGTLCIIMILLAWPLSLFYNEPSLKIVFLIMSLNPLIGGFQNPSLSLFIKKFRVDKLVIFELSLQVFGLLTTIILAYFYRCVEVMAVAVAFGALYRTLGSYIVSRPFPRFRWDNESGSEIFHFGKFIFINTMITWLAGNIDIIMIGKLLGVGELALYNLGKNFAYLAFIICTQMLAQSYFPAISSICKEPHRVIKIYKSTTSFILLLGIPLCMYLSIFSHDIINLLYDSRYETAYISMYWLSLSTIFRLIGTINGSTLIGIGKPSYETLSNFIGLVITIFSLSIGMHLGGLKGAAIGMSISFSLTAITQSIFLRRLLKGECRIILHPWIQVITSILIIIPLFIILKQWLIVDNDNFILFLFSIIIMCGMVSFGTYKLFKDFDFFFRNKGANINSMHNKPFEL